MKCCLVILLTVALVASWAETTRAQIGPGTKVALPAYVLRCTEITMPRTADEAHYKASLAEGVAKIDKTLGPNSSTGTPFIQKSENRVTVVAAASADHPEVSEEQTVVTVCAVVDASSGWLHCTEITMPRTADEAHYKASLAEGAAKIDKTLGPNSSTGTPFIQKSQNRVTVVAAASADHPEVSEEQIVVTVCVVADTSSVNPSDSQVRQENHSNETVFAMKCQLTDADTCIEKLRTSLVAVLNSKLETSSLVTTVPGLLWRSASTTLENLPDAALSSVLVASDVRKVTVAPDVSTSGAQADFDLISSLTKPIDQQVQRPLLHKGPTSYSVKPRPGDKWIVTAILLSPQITGALQ
jgi:hypothetical protein